MKKLVILLILLAAVIFTAGCTEETQEKSGVVEATEPGQNVSSQEKSVVDATTLEQINTSLQEGPVLMKIGSEGCGPCNAMKPMLQELATEYSGKATIMSIDIIQSPALEAYFKIGYVPDSTVIVNVTDGKYVYMKPDGNVTTDRFQARIPGLMEKSVFEDVLNLALLEKDKSKSE
ncbi:MAG: thioredoxin family protein [Methanosarcina sp.]